MRDISKDPGTTAKTLVNDKPRKTVLLKRHLITKLKHAKIIEKDYAYSSGEKPKLKLELFCHRNIAYV